MRLKNTIGIIGLGYVGLPLALAFSKKFQVVAFDKNFSRIKELKKKIARNNEIKKKYLTSRSLLKFTYKKEDLSICNIFIITVPTPIKLRNLPDLNQLKEACILVGKHIKRNSIVILESTVYPGCTEEFCVPIIERVSKLKFNQDFFCGYSPERINPGDKKNELKNIIKITSGSKPKIADIVDKLYRTIIKAGTYKASSIKVAEASKIVENVQRFVNISLINELAIIFEKLNISTKEVLDAASTKWNFLKFKPGLIGGHCIAVDPYYLKYKVKEIKKKSEIINTSLKLHEKLFKFIAKKLVSILDENKDSKKKRILILGITFKENCADYRNSQSVELVRNLKLKGFKVDVSDPWVESKMIKKETGIALLKKTPKKNFYDGIILAVPHRVFLTWGQKKIEGLGRKNFKIIDIKSVLKNKENIWQF